VKGFRATGEITGSQEFEIFIGEQQETSLESLKLHYWIIKSIHLYPLLFTVNHGIWHKKSICHQYCDSGDFD
jgi:hypothetical protein